MYSVPWGYSGRRKGGFLKIMALGQVLKMDRIYTDGNGDGCSRKREPPQQRHGGRNPLGMMNSPTWPQVAMGG